MMQAHCPDFDRELSRRVAFGHRIHLYLGPARADRVPDCPHALLDRDATIERSGERGQR